MRRIVLYVKPTPTLPEARPDRLGRPPTFVESVLTAVTAPRAETITGDIAAIRDHNLRVDRQRVARNARLRHQGPTDVLTADDARWRARRGRTVAPVRACHALEPHHGERARPARRRSVSAEVGVGVADGAGDIERAEGEDGVPDIG